ncbi:MAG: hypothetical protein IPK37_07405 [Austwickia sp.]|nr:MAG: hypothetical protein IPK37_07405 [Austwickia sp.]
MTVLRTISTADLPPALPGHDELPDCMAGRAPVTRDCCSFHQVDWKRAVRFATWAWYCREGDETPQERMARVTDVPEWLVRAAASLLTDPIQLALRGDHPAAIAGGHLRAAVLRQQGCKYAVVAHDWPADEPIAGELIDPAALPHAS